MLGREELLRDNAAQWKGHRTETMSNGKKNKERRQLRETVVERCIRRRKRNSSEIELRKNCKVKWNEVPKYVREY